MNYKLEKVVKIWPEVASVLAMPRTSAEYDDLIEIIGDLMDKINGNYNHHLVGLLDVLTLLAKKYEDEHLSIMDADPVDVLKFLMEEHGLSQSQLPEIGSQGVVSEVLHGIRRLNTKQIEKLSKRFNVSPAVFMKV